MSCEMYSISCRKTFTDFSAETKMLGRSAVLDPSNGSKEHSCSKPSQLPLVRKGLETG